MLYQHSGMGGNNKRSSWYKVWDSVSDEVWKDIGEKEDILLSMNKFGVGFKTEVQETVEIRGTI